jgi:hypothetical protein
MHRETRPVTVHTRRLTIRETHDSLGCGRHAHRFGSSSAAIHHPRLTNCLFHSSALIGSSEMA